MGNNSGGGLSVMKFLVFCFLLFATSHASSNDLGRLENQARFEKLLAERDVSRAARFVPYFLPPRTSRETALLAQYHLLVCQPRTAERYIHALEDKTERELFLAVLYGLVAIERPLSTKPEQTASKTETINVIRFPLDQKEIWRDEWADITPITPPCKRFPLAESHQEKLRYRELAKSLFQKMPSHYFLADFNLVGLALDVGVTPTDIFVLLKRFKTKASDPYYKRLLAAARIDGQQDDQKAIAVSAVGKREVTMTNFHVREQVTTPHAIDIPVVLSVVEEKTR